MLNPYQLRVEWKSETSLDSVGWDCDQTWFYDMTIHIYLSSDKCFFFLKLFYVCSDFKGKYENLMILEC